MASSAPMEVPFGPGGTVLLRKMVLDEDAPLLHDWFSRDYARFFFVLFLNPTLPPFDHLLATF